MAISLNNHESRINSINTNISSLGTRITKLENAPPPKQWEIVNCTLTGGRATLNKDYSGWNYCLLSAMIKKYDPNVRARISNNGKTLYASSTIGGDVTGSLSVSGKSVTLGYYTDEFRTITILFYK